MSHDQRIYLLISLKLSGEASPEELMELETLVTNNPDLLEKIEDMEEVWQQLGRRPTGLAGESFEKHLQRLNNEIFETDAFSRTNSDVQKAKPVRKLLQKKYYRILLGAAAA